jgi:hypothetical protein
MWVFSNLFLVAGITCAVASMIIFVTLATPFGARVRDWFLRQRSDRYVWSSERQSSQPRSSSQLRTDNFPHSHQRTEVSLSAAGQTNQHLEWWRGRMQTHFPLDYPMSSPRAVVVWAGKTVPSWTALTSMVEDLQSSYGRREQTASIPGLERQKTSEQPPKIEAEWTETVAQQEETRSEPTALFPGKRLKLEQWYQDTGVWSRKLH